MLQLKYTVRPWVRTSLPLAYPSSCSSGLSTPILSDLSSEKNASTTRLVDSIPILDLISTYESGRPASTPASSNTLTPPLPRTCPQSRLRLPSSNHRSPESLSRRDANHASPKTTPTVRARGKTVPMISSRPHTPERHTDSALGYTPGSSSKHIASWLSGLLGR